MELRVGKSDQTDQSSPDQQNTSLESTDGYDRQQHEQQQQRWRGQPRLAEGTKRGNSKPDASSSCGPFSTQADCHGQSQFFSSSHVYFLTNWCGDSTTFLVDVGTAGMAADVDATVSLITDDSTVPQMERLFAVVDSNSLSIDFCGQAPREKTIDLPNHALRGDWDSAEHVTKTAATNCTPWSCWSVALPCSKGLVSTWRRNAT